MILVGTDAERDERADERPDSPRALATVLGSGWLPTVLVLLFSVLVLSFYGVSAGSLAAFGSYLLGGVSMPGTLLWRALYGRSRWFVEEIAAGTALGYALEVLTYIAARRLGHPLAVVLWPATVILAFLVVPRLRRHWRGPGPAGRAPLWWSWAICGVIGFVVAWNALTFFRSEGLTWPWYTAPYVDMPYHLALIGEIKHHMPPMIPFVAGQPLDYHWFVYAEMAATSWVTGIEPQTLLCRLSPLPMMAVFIVLIAIIAQRIAGRAWAGPAALLITYLALAPGPYRWYLHAVVTGRYPLVEDGTLVRLSDWSSPLVSPTQTFAAALFAPAMLLLVDLLRGSGRGAGRWSLFAVLLAAVMGTKATYVPLLAAGLTGLLVVHLALRRRVHATALRAAALTALALPFAQFVLFGGASQGMRAAPLFTMQQVTIARITGLGGRAAAHAEWPLLVIALITLICWTFIWCGVLGLACRPMAFLEPPVLLLLGMGAAAMGVVLVFTQPGLSQGFFLQSARPYLSIAAVYGLATAMQSLPGGLLAERCDKSRLVLSMAGAGCCGMLLAWLASRLATARAPSWHADGLDRLLLGLLLPYMALIGAIVVAAAVLTAWGGRNAVLRALRLPLILVMVTGYCLTPAVETFAYQIRTATVTGWRHAPMLAANRSIPAGAVAVGRWLRAHSDPDDLVATNAHCRAWLHGICDNRSFWVSAYTERRVLVEGWGYTATIDDQVTPYSTWVAYRPFWNPQLLAANDEAFRMPSRRAIERLRDHYGVRWLFVDESYEAPARSIGQFARLMYLSGDCAVYQITS
jgi:hypothetical protein